MIKNLSVSECGQGRPARRDPFPQTHASLEGFFFMNLLFKNLKRFIVCVQVFCLHVYMYTMCMPGTGSSTNQQVLLTDEPVLQPLEVS